MNLCVIPARGGSKRIPQKNIREFHGKPMIAWSIEAAKESGCFDRIIVSTDDLEIADIAHMFGAEVPFLRPAELADDFTGTHPVVLHALQFLNSSGFQYSHVCCLYATAPLVQATDISKGFLLLKECDVNSFVFTATNFEAPIERALRIDQESGKSFMVNPQNFTKRSQDCEVMYHDVGQFYWGGDRAWLNNSNLFEDSLPLLLPRWRVQDIDTEVDWTRAELLHKLLLSNSNIMMS